MIGRLYTFLADTFVVPTEWNANFSTLKDSVSKCAKYIIKLLNDIAFPNSDLTQVFNAITNHQNSYVLTSNQIDVRPECEYVKNITESTDYLTIRVKPGLNASARIFFKTNNDRTKDETSVPFKLFYNNTRVSVNDGGIESFPAGMYMLFIYETNGICMAKLISTGV